MARSGFAGMVIAAFALGACAHVSTSDGAVAAGVAAAAGAIEVAELATPSRGTYACGPDNCNGCCDLGGRCVAGTENAACGIRGSVCHDCIVDGHAVCGAGACTAPGEWEGPSAQSTGPAPAHAPFGARIMNGASGSPPCNQVAVLCFPGTTPACETDTMARSSVLDRGERVGRPGPIVDATTENDVQALTQH